MQTDLLLDSVPELLAAGYRLQVYFEPVKFWNASYVG